MSSDRASQLRRFYEDVSAQGQILAATSGSQAPIAAKTGHTIYVQKITVSVTTADAGKTLLFRDTAGTPIPGAIFSGAAVGQFTVDFGDRGFALTEGKGLDAVISAANAAYSYTVEAYRKLTAVAAPA